MMKTDFHFNIEQGGFWLEKDNKAIDGPNAKKSYEYWSAREFAELLLRGGADKNLFVNGEQIDL